MALTDLLNGQQTQKDPAAAMQEIDQLLMIVSGVKDEATYQAAKQQYAEMGGDPSELTPNYDPEEVAQFMQMLVQAKQELGGMNKQPMAAMMGGQ